MITRTCSTGKVDDAAKARAWVAVRRNKRKRGDVCPGVNCEQAIEAASIRIDADVAIGKCRVVEPYGSATEYTSVVRLSDFFASVNIARRQVAGIPGKFLRITEEVIGRSNYWR